jgi:hypothetical protein
MGYMIVRPRPGPTRTLIMRRIGLDGFLNIPSLGRGLERMLPPTLRGRLASPVTRNNLYSCSASSERFQAVKLPECGNRMAAYPFHCTTCSLLRTCSAFDGLRYVRRWGKDHGAAAPRPVCRSALPQRSRRSLGSFRCHWADRFMTRRIAAPFASLLNCSISRSPAGGF